MKQKRLDIIFNISAPTMMQELNALNHTSKTEVFGKYDQNKKAFLHLANWMSTYCK